MDPVNTIKAPAVPLQVQNVDTDQIIPARFLTRKRTEGMPNFCLHDVRYNDDGSKKDIPINDPAFAPARVLVAQSIFGSGSSRESAVWALIDSLDEIQPSGFKAVVAETFGDIFFNNASKNGLLPVRLAVDECMELQRQLLAKPGAEVEISLPEQTITFPEGQTHKFDIDEFRKTCLLRGVDDVSLTNELDSEFQAFESKYKEAHPWI